MFVTYSMTPPFAYNSTPSMNCYRPTMLTQTRNNADDNDDNNNDGRSFGVCEDYDSQNDDDDDDCDDGVHHAHVSFSHRQISRHGDTI